MQREIAVETKKVVDLKIRLNELAPIARLPPELLSEIFIQVALMNAHTLRAKHLPANRAAWNVTHVSHHWREVALNCPSLWSEIEISGSETDHIREMLSRSKRASLNIVADMYDPGETGGLKRVLTELDRIESLKITTIRTAFADLDGGELSASAPRLKNLVMRNASSSADGITSFLSDCAFPSLRVVQLYNFPIPFSHPFFAPSLTCLIFVTFPGAHPYPPRVSDLIRVLTGMALLQHLEYSGTLIDDDATQSVTLTQLKYLKVHNSSGLSSTRLIPFSKFLDQLCVPRSAEVLVDLTSTEMADVGLRIMSSINRMLTGGGRIGGGSPVKAISIRNQSDGKTAGCTFSFWPDTEAIKNYIHSRCEPPFRLVLPWVAHLDSELWPWCKHLPLSNVEACIWGCPTRRANNSETLGGWQDSLSLMRNLKWLQVIGEGGKYLPNLLERLNYPDGSESEASSKLETLIIDTVNFRVPGSMPRQDSQYIHDLTRTLSGFSSLKTIDLRECSNFFDRDLKEFERQGLPVRWDHAMIRERSPGWRAIMQAVEYDLGLDLLMQDDADDDGPNFNLPPMQVPVPEVVFGLF